jgi:hypothetical protein
MSNNLVARYSCMNLTPALLHRRYVVIKMTSFSQCVGYLADADAPFLVLDVLTLIAACADDA